MISIVCSVLLLSFACLTQSQQQCPIGHLSFNRDKCYFAISSAKNYADAESDCKTRATEAGIDRQNAFLVSISSTFENAFVTAAATDDTTCTEFYIGLNSNVAGWQWTDGSTFSYNKWNTGCPTNNTADRCATITDDGLWCNRDCASSYCYICETIIDTTNMITNPKFTFTASPPTAWTYFPVTTLSATAVGSAFFPRQSMYQVEAMNRANSDIMAAFLSAMQSQNLNAFGIILTTTYTPDMISNCYFGGMNVPAFPPILGQDQTGTMRGTAVIESVLTSCNPPTQTTPVSPVAFLPYTKQVTITTAGSSLALPESTWNTIATQMMAFLSVNSFVGFTTPITVSG